MATIFLSYTRQSEASAKGLVHNIETLGHSVWFDHELSGGQDWWNQILNSIRECDIFVFTLDPDSLESTACQREFSYAAELGKPVLPILVSGEISTALLPPALSKIQLVDYKQQDNNSALLLARAFSSVPPAGTLPDPLPKPPEVPVSYIGSLLEQIDSSDPLSLERQSVLLLELKKCLRDDDTNNDTQILVTKFRKRRDLLAAIADELDELLTNKEYLPQPSSEQKQENSKKSRVQIISKFFTLTYSKPTIKGRILAALIVSIMSPLTVLMFYGFVYEGDYSILFFGVFFTGLISGLISGMNTRIIFYALIGLFVIMMPLLFIRKGGDISDFLLMFAIFVEPIIALVSIYLAKKKLSISSKVVT